MKIILVSILLILILFSGCTKTDSEINENGTGSIVFTANGEDFVRRGFIDKTGWEINFDNVFVNIANPTAYMSGAGEAEAVLNGEYWIDLAVGSENAAPIIIGKLENQPAGNYQSLKFTLKVKTDGEYAGTSAVLIGTAKKESYKREFIIRLDEEIIFDGKDGYVGNEVKGLLKPGDKTSIEMTFHFDHIFGDIEAPSNSHINTGAVGFDFFNRFSVAGMINIFPDTLKAEAEYSILYTSIFSLGHLGEGHCEAEKLGD